MAYFKRADNTNHWLAEYDPYHALIRAKICRMYQDAKGAMTQTGGYAARKAGIKFFEDCGDDCSEFSLWCDMLGADPETVLVGMEQIEKADG